MADLAPFRGLRFDPGVVGDLAAVTAPPYDAIGADEQQRLLQRHPHNVVRLELDGSRTSDDETPEHRYARAATCHHAWRRSGAVRVDADPAMYVYEQVFAARHQQGIVAALHLEDWDAGVVLPHERVMRAPVADRKALLRALPVNVSPVFTLVPETPEPVARLLDQTARDPAEVDFMDDDGVRHRLWSVPDVGAHARIADAYAARSLLMADGHHRYTAALEHHAEHPGPGTDRIMAYIVGADRGPVIDATHRLVRELPPDALERLRAVGVTTRPADDAEAVAEALRDAPPATFGLLTTDGCQVLHVDPDLVAPLVADVPAPVDALDITRLQALLLDVLRIPDREDTLRYTSELAGAVAAVHGGAFDALLLVRPVTFAQFRAAAEAGVRMPPKSTAFRPKPRTGLVLRPLAPDADTRSGDGR